MKLVGGRERYRVVVPRMVLGIALGIMATPAAGPALAQQDLRPLLERIQRMERDLGTLQQQVYGGPPRPRGGAAGGVDNHGAPPAAGRPAPPPSGPPAPTPPPAAVHVAAAPRRPPPPRAR